MRMIRSASIVAAALSAFAVQVPAHADTHLFTVRTTKPAVTVVQAVRNGVSLAVAGVNGNDTVFRLENPNGKVPCANRIEFVTSQGEHIDSSVNLCNSNWDLTVAVGTSGGSAGGSAPPPPPPATVQPVYVATDDPHVTIQQVFLSGKPVQIAARQDPYVEIDLAPGSNSFACARDLGLALSDGRRIARDVDVCQSNYVVVVSLLGGSAPPLPNGFRPPDVVQPPPPSPPLTGQPPPPPFDGPNQPAPDQGQSVWTTTGDRNGATLIYGVPNSDAFDFEADCKRGDASAYVTVGGTFGINPGDVVPVNFNTTGYANTFSGVGGQVSSVDGMSHPTVEVGLDDGLWGGLIRGRSLAVTIGRDPSTFISLSGSAAKVQEFLSRCTVPVVQPPPQPLPPQPVPPLGIPGNGTPYSCQDNSEISIAFSGGSATVYEAGATPVTLGPAPSNIGRRYVGDNAELRIQGSQAVWSDGYATRYCLQE